MSDLERFMTLARAAYEEAKINYNTGKCTAEQLDRVRITLENLERKASALTSTDGKSL